MLLLQIEKVKASLDVSDILGTTCPFIMPTAEEVENIKL